MANASFPEDPSIGPTNELLEEPDSASETMPFPSLESNLVLEQVLPPDSVNPNHPYQGMPLTAPSIVDQPQIPVVDSSPQIRHTPSSTVPNPNVTKYFWLLVLGGAMLALFAVSDFRARHSPPIPHTQPTRIPQMNP